MAAYRAAGVLDLDQVSGANAVDAFPSILVAGRWDFPALGWCQSAVVGPVLAARVLTGRAAVSQSLESMGLERYPKVVIDEPSFDVVGQC